MVLVLVFSPHFLPFRSFFTSLTSANFVQMTWTFHQGCISHQVLKHISGWTWFKIHDDEELWCNSRGNGPITSFDEWRGVGTASTDKSRLWLYTGRTPKLAEVAVRNRFNAVDKSGRNVKQPHQIKQKYTSTESHLGSTLSRIYYLEIKSG